MTSGPLSSSDDNGNISIAATLQPSQLSATATSSMNRNHHSSSSQAPATSSTNTAAATMTLTETVEQSPDEVLMLSLRGRPSVTW